MKLGDKYYALWNDDAIFYNFLRAVYGEENEVIINKKTKVKSKLSKETIIVYRKKGMSREEIAKRMGVPMSQYYKVCRALGVPLKRTRPRFNHDI